MSSTFNNFVIHVVFPPWIASASTHTPTRVTVCFVDMNVLSISTRAILCIQSHVLWDILGPLIFGHALALSFYPSTNLLKHKENLTFVLACVENLFLFCLVGVQITVKYENATSWSRFQWMTKSYLAEICYYIFFFQNNNNNKRLIVFCLLILPNFEFRHHNFFVLILVP